MIRISPETLAKKFEAANSGESAGFARELAQSPRLAELLWFIQWQSHQHGGLEGFAARLLEKFSAYVGTPAMIAIGDGPFRPQQAFEIEDEAEKIFHYERAHYGALCLTKIAIEEAVNAIREKQSREDIANRLGKARSEIMTFAKQQLPGELQEFCTNPAVGFFQPWYLNNLPDFLMRFMDMHKQEAQTQIAETEVARQIFEGLEFAASESVLVMIEGNSRFGKTHALANWCERRPGIARMVTVPCTTSTKSFFRAIGKVLGIEFRMGVQLDEMQERVGYVMEMSSIMLVLDEAQWLLPQRFSKKTAPLWLNWLRSEIIDKGLPCAIAVTPQSFHRSLTAFVKETGFTAEQFLGRIACTIKLPDTIEKEDCLNVARKHFPQEDERLLRMIAVKVSQLNGHLQLMENAARLARFYSRQAGTPIRIEHIEKAFSQVLPSVVSTMPAAFTHGRRNTPNTSSANEAAADAARRELASDGMVCDPEKVLRTRTKLAELRAEILEDAGESGT